MKKVGLLVALFFISCLVADAYYDVVNFAMLLTVTGFYSWGLNDETTPSTVIYAVYNSIKAPEQLFIVPEEIHPIYPEKKIKVMSG